MTAQLREAFKILMKDRVSYSIVYSLIIFRLIFSALVPLGADESYYFDWSHAIHLSYFDHPPGVSWLAYLGQFLFGENQFGARFGSIILHFLATLALIEVSKKFENPTPKSTLRAIVFCTSFAPILSLGGFFIMPDIGLIFFLSLLALKALNILKSGRLEVSDALICGILWGMAFNFKYHALAIGGGLMMGIFIHRFKKIKHEIGFWLTLILTPLMTALPVFIWNYQHEWASFLFQTNHGFAKPSFDIRPGFGTLIAQFLLMTPIVMWQYLKSASSIKKSPYHLTLVLGTLPLGVLLIALAFFKEVLPHWIIPALWLSIPITAINIGKMSSRLLKLNFIYGFSVILFISFAVGIKPAKELLLKNLNGKTGSLAELTIWDYIYEDPEVQNLINSSNTSQCELTMLSFRWFSTAQLAARFNTLKVYNLDKVKPSYYNYRDENYPSGNCPVIVIGNKKHLREDDLAAHVEIKDKKMISPKFHEDHKYFIAKGLWK